MTKKPNAENEAAMADRLLTEAFSMVEQVTATLADLNRKLEATHRRIEGGEIHRRAEADMRQWLVANPQAAAQFRMFLTQRN